jgi:hypothetical protein
MLEGLGDGLAGIGSFFELLFRSVFWTFRRAFSKPKDGGSRLRLSHLVYALSPISGFVLFTVGLICIVGWFVGREERLREKTQVIVEAEADRLWNRVDKDGRLTVAAPGEPKVEDAWGREILVITDRGILKDKVVVRSLGHDGKKGTIDDVVAIRTLANQDQEIAQEALGRLLDFAKERLDKGE